MQTTTENNMTIKTNHNYRPLLNAYELTKRELNILGNYLEEDAMYFRYKGEIYNLGDFTRTASLHEGPLKEWDGYLSDSFFSGIVIKLNEEFDMVKVGTYISWHTSKLK